MTTKYQELEPTEKQIAILERWGYPVPATRREATKMISDEIEFLMNRAINDWDDTPSGVDSPFNRWDTREDWNGER